jgi:hypothetical protein
MMEVLLVLILAFAFTYIFDMLSSWGIGFFIFRQDINTTLK